MKVHKMRVKSYDLVIKGEAYPLESLDILMINTKDKLIRLFIEYPISEVVSLEDCSIVENPSKKVVNKSLVEILARLRYFQFERVGDWIYVAKCKWRKEICPPASIDTLFKVKKLNNEKSNDVILFDRWLFIDNEVCRWIDILANSYLTLNGHVNKDGHFALNFKDCSYIWGTTSGTYQLTFKYSRQLEKGVWLIKDDIVWANNDTRAAMLGCDYWRKKSGA